ncbi:MAG: LysR family transcriptional regulator [Gemmatimonadetes bacterium]|nr:LysR family transcriptional regulator [Gemmatimonadota bacterium]
MLDIADLRVFVRITDAASISGAARALGMPKSSVSRSLTRIEGSVGATLVERSTRRLRLTDAGLLLQRHARRILEEVGEAEDAIAGFVGVPRGTLRVSAPPSFAAGPLAPMLPAFVARYPELRVVLSFDNQPIVVLPDDVDVAIRAGALPDSDLVARRLARTELWTCASPAYLSAFGTPTTVEELSGHQRVTLFDRRTTWRFRTPAGPTQELAVDPGLVVPEHAIARTVLIGGAGIGQLPVYHARDAIADGTLVRLLPDHEGERVDVHALYPRQRSLSAKVRAFVDALTAHLAPS